MRLRLGIFPAPYGQSYKSCALAAGSHGRLGWALRSLGYKPYGASTGEAGRGSAVSSKRANPEEIRRAAVRDDARACAHDAWAADADVRRSLADRL